MASWLALLVSITSVVGTAGELNCNELKTFFVDVLNPYQQRVDDAQRNYQDAQWKVETAAPDANPTEMNQLFEKLQAAIYDKNVLAEVVRVDTACGALSDCAWKPKLTRVRQILEGAILSDDKVIQKENENQAWQNRLIEKSNGFRIPMEGQAEPVSKALYGKKLATEPNRALREKWYKAYNSSRAKAWLEWGFRDLLKSRNEEAKRAGFADYFAYRFSRNQLGLAGYEKLVDDIRSKLAPKLQKKLKQIAVNNHIEQIQPWDIAYLRTLGSSGAIDSALETLPAEKSLDVARTFYSSMGFAIDDYHFTMDLYPRPGKNTHAFAMAVVYPRVDDIGQLISSWKPDIRFLANLKAPVKWSDLRTVVHELGHAVHMAEIRQFAGPLRDCGTIITEAIAMSFEKMLSSSPSIRKVFHALQLPALSEDVLASQAAATQFDQAYLLVRQAFFSEFEQKLYQNPSVDIAGLWVSLSKKYLGIDVVKEQADWDVEHYLMAPVYIQNYVLGLVMVEQIVSSLQKEFGTVFDTHAIGEKLRRVYFSPGIELNYPELTQEFTGNALSANAALSILD